MIIVGLTGSIATGKSTVAKLLQNSPYFIPVIDADQISRDVVRPGCPAYRQIIRTFASDTPDLLSPSGSGDPFINRDALGKRVFGNDPAAVIARQKLNSIVHPAVRRAIRGRILREFFSGSWCVVLDIPLLYEPAGFWFRTFVCSSIVVVGVSDAKIQLERLMNRNNQLTRTDAIDRIKSQTQIQEKMSWAKLRGEPWGFVILNDIDDARFSQNHPQTASSHACKLDDQVSRIISILRSCEPPYRSRLLLYCPPLACLAAAKSMWTNAQLHWQWARKQFITKNTTSIPSNLRIPGENLLLSMIKQPRFTVRLFLKPAY